MAVLLNLLCATQNPILFIIKFKTLLFDLPLQDLNNNTNLHKTQKSTVCTAHFKTLRCVYKKLKSDV